jgi:hypothetical protein
MKKYTSRIVGGDEEFCEVRGVDKAKGQSNIEDRM